MDNSEKKVSVPLALGIVFLPILFCWVLLKKGYSTQARVIGFGYPVLMYAIGFGMPTTQPSPKVQPPTSVTSVVEQKPSTQIAKKDGTIDTRENDLDELCKDYVFYRAKILKHSRNGDESAAEESRRSFEQVNVWLSDYDETDVANTCAKYE